MKIKGFTLIELLAVIVILGLLAMVAVPAVNRTIKESKENLYKIQIKNIETGAKNWATDNLKLLPEEDNTSITLTLGQLKVGDYIQEDIKDPRSGKLFPNDMEIIIKRVKNSYSYIVDLESGTEGNTEEPKEGPIIILNGESTLYVELGSTYEELGAIARNKDGSINSDITIEIKSNNVVIPNVETDRFGEYKITYSITEGDQIAKVTRTVIVRDTTPPVLIVPDNITIKVEDVGSFNALSGVSATDNNGETVSIKVYGNVSSISGTYLLTYVATDTKGNQTIKSRVITVTGQVNPNPDPDPTPTPGQVNAPVLSSGMKPIKWVNGVETVTTASDPEWYDYDNKKWANVKTNDGSYWVWIPRYAYRITRNYHTNITGAIDIKFLSGTTNTAYDGTTILTSGYSSGTKDTSMNYFKHPAFTFGEEISGFWAAKFEASVYDTSDACYKTPADTACNKVTLYPTIQPNRNSWRYITIGNMFTVSINMRNNTIYGWLSNEVDTHMMKNSEWGAVTYLAQSNYGKVNEVWINNSNTYTTGCAGDSVNAGSYSGCQFAYTTGNGQQASTTGNITGIYDMSGGAWEYVSAYVNNGNDNLTTNGQSIISAHNKYKDIYSVGTSDTIESNYGVAKNKYGDAVYETSSEGTGVFSWNGDYALMPTSSSPWFFRGGYYGNASTAGLFDFNGNAGATSSDNSFRVTLHVFE